jgi:hypothetical protein
LNVLSEVGVAQLHGNPRHLETAPQIDVARIKEPSNSSVLKHSKDSDFVGETIHSGIILLAQELHRNSWRRVLETTKWLRLKDYSVATAFDRPL